MHSNLYVFYDLSTIVLLFCLFIFFTVFSPFFHHFQAVKGKVGVIMAGKNQRENMDWVMTELDLHHVKDRDVEVRVYLLVCLHDRMYSK